MEGLWSREALVRYVLSACQAPHGGLRDKPGKGPDFYHSAYVLMGLSAGRWRWRWEGGKGEGGVESWGWREVEVVERLGVEEDDPDGYEVRPVHPVYNVPVECVQRVREWAGREVLGETPADA